MKLSLKRDYILSFFLICFTFTFSSPSWLFALERRTLNESDIKQKIIRHIEKKMSWSRESVRVTFPDGVQGLPISLDNFVLELKENKNDERIGKKTYTIKIFHGTHFYKQLSVPTFIEVCTELVLSSRRLEREAILQEQDLVVVKEWVSRLPKDIVTDPKHIIGKRLLRSMRERSPFAVNMISNPILFKKGKTVKIVFDNNIMNITTLGIAEEAGTYGAVVRIRNISSSRIIHARVIGDSVVKVEI